MKSNHRRWFIRGRFCRPTDARRARAAGPVHSTHHHQTKEKGRQRRPLLLPTVARLLLTFREFADAAAGVHDFVHEECLRGQCILEIIIPGCPDIEPALVGVSHERVELVHSGQVFAIPDIPGCPGGVVILPFRWLGVFDIEVAFFIEFSCERVLYLDTPSAAFLPDRFVRPRPESSIVPLRARQVIGNISETVLDQCRIGIHGVPTIKRGLIGVSTNTNHH